MYSVVGCSSCRALWVVDGHPETTQCPRCRTRHEFDSVKTFAETETSDAAARARSAMLADRADDGEFVDPADVDPDDVGMTEAGFLQASGVDTDAVDGTDAHVSSGRESPSRRQIVLDALADLEEPTDDSIREYAADRGVDATYVERALGKLQRAGEVTETDGVYRPL